MQEEHPCPVCQTMCIYTELRRQPDRCAYFPCPTCGEYRITMEALAGLVLDDRPDRRPVLSHAIRKMVQANAGSHTPPTITTALAEEVIAHGTLPDPPEQVDNVILHLGDTTTPGKYVGVQPEHRALIGAVDPAGVAFVLDYMQGSGLLDCQGNRQPRSVQAVATLTVKGWTRYRELQRGGVQSRVAFMAMPFGFAELNEMFTTHVRPAVADTGYDLRLVTDNAPAGSIDNRLRVDIRRSRFVVCELTGANLGAYWEAGYGEGLGRPVLYLCRKDLVDNHKVHFDARQQNITTWDPGQEADAMDRLKATIRVTIPEAKQDDSHRS